MKTVVEEFGSSPICINGIRGDTNLSSKGVKFKHSGFTGNPILLALEQTCNFPSLLSISQRLLLKSQK